MILSVAVGLGLVALFLVLGKGGVQGATDRQRENVGTRALALEHENDGAGSLENAFEGLASSGTHAVEGAIIGGGALSIFGPVGTGIGAAVGAGVGALIGPLMRALDSETPAERFRAIIRDALAAEDIERTDANVDFATFKYMVETAKGLAISRTGEIAFLWGVPGRSEGDLGVWADRYWSFAVRDNTERNPAPGSAGYLRIGERERRGPWTRHPDTPYTNRFALYWRENFRPGAGWDKFPNGPPSRAAANRALRRVADWLGID
jgi:hypothetical protein